MPSILLTDVMFACHKNNNQHSNYAKQSATACRFVAWSYFTVQCIKFVLNIKLPENQSYSYMYNSKKRMQIFICNNEHTCAYKQLVCKVASILFMLKIQ